MTLGRAPTTEPLFSASRDVCAERLSETSLYQILHRECHRLFPEDAFADLFQDTGRRSISPRIVAVVMVLQRHEGLSDREAVERFTYDLRWKHAAGGLDVDFPGFVHTVLVDMRARLRRSERPDRIFEAVLDVAKAAGLVGRRRVLDSTPLYDAVATQDTVTMIRSAIRQLLQAADVELAATLRATLQRDDDYATAGKPVCDWDDGAAREALVDALARDGFALLALLDGQALGSEVGAAASLLATVLGQDIETGEDGLFRIARRVAPDRMISTVDPEARHGHKTAARGFDGYKGHIAIDPDSEIITNTTVTPGNAGDGSVALELLADVLQGAKVASAPADSPQNQPAVASPSTDPDDAPPPDESALAPPSEPPVRDPEPPADVVAVPLSRSPAPAPEVPATETAAPPQPIEVYGDASYGTADVLAALDGRASAFVKVQPPAARDGFFSKDRFGVDKGRGRVTCPADRSAAIQRRPDGGGMAYFGAACADCALRAQCTKSKKGRSINVHRQEALLARERQRQRDAAWRKQYRETRPKVERKLAHLMRRRHGGRRARMRGRVRIGQDFALLSAAVNLARLAVLGVRSRAKGESGPTWTR